MSDLTVDLIRKYAKSLNKNRPAFPDKSDKLLLIEPSKLGKLSIVDVETTDLTLPPVEITELAIQQYLYDKDTFEILGLGESFNELNEPSDLAKITLNIVALTGITPEMVKGKKINWEKAQALLNECDYIIAHNAKFDKTHISAQIQTSAKWLCSCNGVDWSSKGAPNKKLEILCLHFGEFTFSGHRAIEDVLSTGILIEKTDVLKEMIENASKVTCKVEGYLDAFGKQTIKDIITKKDNIVGHIFKMQAEFNPATNKKDYWYEVRNLNLAQVEDIKVKLMALVLEHNAKGADKIKITAVEQNI